MCCCMNLGRDAYDTFIVFLFVFSGVPIFAAPATGCYGLYVKRLAPPANQARARLCSPYKLAIPALS